jgi:hypothetical protein
MIRVVHGMKMPLRIVVAGRAAATGLAEQGSGHRGRCQTNSIRAVQRRCVGLLRLKCSPSPLTGEEDHSQYDSFISESGSRSDLIIRRF